MKFLGHAWVAVNAYPQGNKRLLIFGSVIPEIMYYTKNHPFKAGEIHEGGDKVYLYLKEKSPELTDFGLGMLAHSVKAGADRYNFDKNLGLLGFEGKKIIRFRKRLTDILEIDYQTAKIRTHNILELGIDLKIIQEHPDFIKDFVKVITDKKLKKQSIEILSDCFKKPKKAVEKSVNELFNKAKPSYFKNAYGLVDLWTQLAKEFDPKPKKEKLAKLFQELSTGYGEKSEKYLRKCISWTRSKLEKFNYQ